MTQTPPPTRPPTTLADTVLAVNQSRRLLIDTLHALSDFSDAITIVGAHAVHLWAADLWGTLPMPATRDADLAINPVFVTPDPKLLEMMENIGVTPALQDRPGVYGYTTEGDLPLSLRTTIDLIVPEAYAGPGRRAARIAGQAGAASRAVGLELAIWDRQVLTLSSPDEPHVEIDAWVAGPAALLVAKAHKIHERLAQFATRPDRLRQKDSGDVGLLMMVSDPVEVAQIMATQSTHHPEIAPVVADAAQWLIDMYADPSALVRSHAAESLSIRFKADEVADAMDTWIMAFSGAARLLRA